RIDIARHGARENFSRWRHRPDGQRPFDPGADEAHLVVEANAALALELADLLFDLLADAVAPFFECADLPFDLALDNDLPDLQKPELALDPSLKLLQGRERHGGKSHTASGPLVERSLIQGQRPGSRSHAELARLALSPSRNSFTLPKKPDASGCVSFDD